MNKILMGTVGIVIGLVTINILEKSLFTPTNKKEVNK